MKLENLVITLQQAARLKELWFTKPSFFSRKATFKWDGGKCKWEVLPSEDAEKVETLPAYTLSELWEFLPDGCCTMREDGVRQAYTKDWNGFFVSLWNSLLGRLRYWIGSVEPTIEANEVQTRCALLIDLLETGALLPGEGKDEDAKKSMSKGQ